VSRTPKFKLRIYTEFQRGLLVSSILWMFSIMCYLGLSEALKLWLRFAGLSGLGFAGFILLFAVLILAVVGFLNWLFKKLYASRYRLFPGGDQQ